MLRVAESVSSFASLAGAKLQFRRLVLQASTFSHILDWEEERSTAGVFGHPLWKLSPSRRGAALQEVARSVLQRAYPDSQFQDPVAGMSASGFPRRLHQAAWDWTMDGRRVECKSSSLFWHKVGRQWRAQFHAVKLMTDFDNRLRLTTCY